MKPKNESRPKYWRSLAELEGDPKFHEFVEREFRTPVEQTDLDSEGRRRFMQLMGASFALAGCSYKEEKLLPHTAQPEGFVPGIPVFYSTVVDIAGVATGLRVKSFDGRPIKVDGNPLDSVTKGGTGPIHQAQVLGLYDPDRSSNVLQGKEASTWKAFDAALLAAFQEASAKGGSGFAVLSRASSSPSLFRLADRLKKSAPAMTWTTFEASHTVGPEKGAELAFGKKLSPHFRPEKADILVALDSDIGNAATPGALGYVREIANRRDPDTGEMSRIYAFEPTLSDVGSLADHRFMVKPSQVPAIVAYLDAQISAARAAAISANKDATKEEQELATLLAAAQPAPDEAALGGASVKTALDVVVKDLLAQKAGASLVSLGSKYAPEVHATVFRINLALGNVGSTVSFVEPATKLAGGVDELAALVADIEANKVETLLILGGNPVYDAPFDLGFAAALSKVKNSFHVGLYVDETAQKCTFHAPETHFLESFDDATAIDGTRRLAQPLIDPVLGGRSLLEVLGRLTGLSDYSALAIVKATSGLGEDAFQKALHDGLYGPAIKPADVKLANVAPLALGKSDGLEVLFDMDPALFDGRYANNAWLQELPHPLTKLAWGNAAMVSPATASELNIKDGFVAKVTVEGQTLEIPAMVVPGQVDGTIALSLGHGREAAGVVGGSRGYVGSVSQDHSVEIVGSNTYALRSSKSLYFATGTISSTDKRAEQLAITQDLWAIDDIGKQGQHEREDQLIREATLAEYKEHPSVIDHKVHHPPLLSLWQPPVSYDGHKWGLAVDLNKCTGCAGCLVACQSENNIAVVGRKEVALGREMTWIRVERYYKGTDKKPSVRQQPVMCQQCENAPCEQVCPVGATMHTREGLNDMVYNRCIGTRYCSNNCPYKVRRFNYRNYNLETIGMTPYTANEAPRGKLKAMAFNPEVTVRGRGVMEKCTFCVQRIQNVKIQAKNKKRPIEDGEIKTACEEACATGAIYFGDLNDKKSRVAAAQKVPRAYELLAELNNRPRVNYLARISNPHPELSTQDGHSEHH